MRRIKKLPAGKQHGFTIVELMIATLVFSVILLVITYGVLSFTKNYYKGVNSSTTQNAGRTVIDAVTQAIQTSQTTVSTATGPGFGGTVNTYCIGNVQFDFRLNAELTNLNPDVLVESPLQSSGCKSYASVSSSQQELLGPRMRVLAFTVSPITGLPSSSLQIYNITVQVAYGDDDQLCNSNSAGDCAAPGNSTHLEDPGEKDTCKPGAGAQFCDVVTLNTTAQMRALPQ